MSEQIKHSGDKSDTPAVINEQLFEAGLMRQIAVQIFAAYVIACHPVAGGGKAGGDDAAKITATDDGDVH